MTQKRILSGMQPTNNLHVGNYLGALKNWVKLQDDKTAECLYCVVDLHAITANYDPTNLAQNTREITAGYIAAGVDPARSTIFLQSAVPQHPYLMWLLATMTQMGKLNRMTQFKDKAGKDKEKAGLGLYSYPVLMAADILLYHATHVPVGDDQVQHIELARDIVATFNHRYNGEHLTSPEAVLMPDGARIMSLRDGTNKMSKSAQSDMTRINLTDDADLIAKKFKKAKTDTLGGIPDTIKSLEDRPEVKNLLTIYAALNDQKIEEIVTQYAGTEMSAFKTALTDMAVAKLAPMTSEVRRLLDNPSDIDAVLHKGADKARSIAAPTLDKVMDVMGFLK